MWPGQALVSDVKVMGSGALELSHLRKAEDRSIPSAKYRSVALGSGSVRRMEKAWPMVSR